MNPREGARSARLRWLYHVPQIDLNCAQCGRGLPLFAIRKDSCPYCEFERTGGDLEKLKLDVARFFARQGIVIDESLRPAVEHLLPQPAALEVERYARAAEWRAHFGLPLSRVICANCGYGLPYSQVMEPQACPQCHVDLRGSDLYPEQVDFEHGGG